MKSNRNRKFGRSRLLSAAVLAGLTSGLAAEGTQPFDMPWSLGACFDGDGDGGKGGDGGKKKDGEGDDGKKKDEPEKISLTNDELNARIEAAVTKRERELEKAQKDEQDKKDREKKKNEKDYAGLYESEVTKTRTLESENTQLKMDGRRKDVSIKLFHHLAEHQPEYVSCSKYIVGQVEFDAKTDDAEIDKRIKGAVDQYVKDNPRQAKSGGGGAPAPGGKGRILPEGKGEGAKGGGSGEGNGDQPETRRRPRYMNQF